MDESNPAPRLPGLAPDAHKGDAGRILIVAGSRRYSGAARLAASAAALAGPGLLHAAVPASLAELVAAHDPSLIVHALPETRCGSFAWRAGKEVLALARTMDAALVGPGLGEHPETRAFARRLVSELELPTVVDADALNALAEGSTRVAPAGPRIYTPHPGEAARLLGRSTRSIGEDREAAARELLELLGGVTVLKGAGTLIASAEGLRYNRTGNAALARGGSGDLLAGLMTALIPRLRDPWAAASAAVYLHGAAADRALESMSPMSLNWVRLVEALSRVIDEHSA